MNLYNFTGFGADGGGGGGGEQELLLPAKALVVGWLLLLLLCAFAAIRVDEREQSMNYRRRRKTMKDPKIRRKAILRSLTVRKIVAADPDGILTLGRQRSGVGANTVAGYEDGEEDNFDDTSEKDLAFSEDAPLAAPEVAQGSDECERGMNNNNINNAAAAAAIADDGVMLFQGRGGGDNDNDIDDDDDDGECGSSTGSEEEEEEASSTCVICLDPFRVGDVVAWRKSRPADFSDTAAAAAAAAENLNTCCHVMHKECIISWLMANKDDCPACRTVIMLYDDEGEGEAGNVVDGSCCDGGEDENSSSSSSSSSSAAGSIFVIVHGLVSRVRRRQALSLPPKSCRDLDLCCERRRRVSLLPREQAAGGVRGLRQHDSNTNSGSEQHLSSMRRRRRRRMFSGAFQWQSLPSDAEANNSDNSNSSSSHFEELPLAGYGADGARGTTPTSYRRLLCRDVTMASPFQRPPSSSEHQSYSLATSSSSYRSEDNDDGVAAAAAADGADDSNVFVAVGSGCVEGGEGEGDVELV